MKPRRSQNTTVTSRRWLARAGSGGVDGGDHLRHLRRQESLQAADAIDFRQLRRDPLLERLIPARKLLGLLLELRRLLLDGIVQVLDAQQRTHAGKQRRLLERLGEIVVAPASRPLTMSRVSAFAVTRMTGTNFCAASSLSSLEHRDAVELRHHDVEQREVGLELASTKECLFSIRRSDDLVALDSRRTLRISRLVGTSSTAECGADYADRILYLRTEIPGPSRESARGLNGFAT